MSCYKYPVKPMTNFLPKKREASLSNHIFPSTRLETETLHKKLEFSFTRTNIMLEHIYMCVLKICYIFNLQIYIK